MVFKQKLGLMEKSGNATVFAAFDIECPPSNAWVTFRLGDRNSQVFSEFIMSSTVMVVSATIR